MVYFIGLAFAIAIAMGSLMIPRILLVSAKRKLFDNPNARKVHKVPVPRLGGVAFFPTLLMTMAVVMGLRYSLHEEIEIMNQEDLFVEFCGFVTGIMGLYLCGLKDDLVGMNYKKKFVAQIIAACMFPLTGLWINYLYGFLGIYEIPAVIGMPLTVLVVVYIVNAINLIDGIDGLASGLSMIAFMVMGTLFALTQQWVFSFMAAAGLGVLIPFFYYNVKHNKKHFRKIFMGDAGSLTLGYLLSFLLLHAVMITDYNRPFYHGFAMVAFGTLVIPTFDVMRVMVSRWRDGRPVFKPDMNHIHHKCLRTGMNTTQVMVLLLLMSLVFIQMNYMLANILNGNVLLVDIALWIGMHYVMNYFVARHEKKMNRKKSREIEYQFEEEDPS